MMGIHCTFTCFHGAYSEWRNARKEHGTENIDRQQGSRAAHHNKSVNKTRDAPAPSLPPRLLPAPVVVTRNSLFRFNISEFVSY